MGRSSKLLALSDEHREELNERLRAEAYGKLAELVRWLQEVCGCETSVASLHRYSQALQQRDAASGREVAVIRKTMRERSAKPLSGGTRKEQLLMELGRLALYQRQLMDELMPLMHEEETPVLPVLPCSKVEQIVGH